jgi:hypothetical protein
VLDRLELADLYQIQSLYSSCGQWVRRNLKIVKKDAKWLELLKNKAPELALELVRTVWKFLFYLNNTIFSPSDSAT